MAVLNVEKGKRKILAGGICVLPNSSGEASFCGNNFFGLLQASTGMMDSVYPEPLSRLHRRAVRKKFHKNSARYRTQPVTFAEIQEVDEEQVNDETQTTGMASKSDLDLKAKFEEFKRQRDKDLLEIRLTTNGPEGESKSEVKVQGERTTNSKDVENGEMHPLPTTSSSILPYRGSFSCSRTSI